MILYYVSTSYQQVACIVHRLLYARNEEAHLYISDINHPSSDFLKRFMESGFFDKVTLLKEDKTWEMASEVKFGNEKELKKVLKSITQFCYKSLLHPIEKYKDCYVFSDHSPFGFVLSFNNIPYHYFEEAAGVYSFYEIWMKKLLEQNNQFLYLVGEKVGFYGKAECVVDYWIDIDKQHKKFKNSKIKDFSVKKLLKKIKQDDIKKILYIYGINEIIDINETEKISLILTEYLAGAKVCTWDEQRIVYGMLIDYFCKNTKVYIKPHPNDHQGIYKRWFNNVEQIDKNIPSELIPFIFNKKIDKIISFCSTSYESLIENAKETIAFRNKDIRTEKLFRSMNKYYISVKMILNLKDDYSIFCIGSDTNQVRYFFKSEGKEKKDIYETDSFDKIPYSEKKHIFIIDDLSFTRDVTKDKIQSKIQSAQESDIFIFINSANDVIFFNEELYSWVENTVPIKIKEVDKNNNTKIRWVFMITKDIEARKVFLTEIIDLMLKNTGIKISVNEEESFRERVLEGMLFATEQKCKMLAKRK